MPQTILLIKNFSGSFNDEGIGHEIINSFDRNDNDTDYYYFYVPPYGSVGKEDESFYQEDLYRNIKIILVFDSTSITNILKLKAVVKDPIPFNSFEEVKTAASNAKYGPNDKPLNIIDFKDKEFLEALDLEEPDDYYVFPITYKVNKDKYFNLEDLNIFIWHKRSEKTNNKKEESIKQFRMAFGEDAVLKELNRTTLGQKNYAYNLGDDLYAWFEEEIEPLLTDENKWELESVDGEIEFPFNYNKNNILAFLDKINDENIYTNFIKGILLCNDQLKNQFFSLLVHKYFGVNNYQPSNAVVLTQQQSLIEEKKVLNSYLKNKQNQKYEKAAEKAKSKLINEYGYTEEMINNAQKANDGQMDLYLYDDNYRIVIENKILSGINGKHETVDGQITQLDTYRTYIDDLNTHPGLDVHKENKVILLIPDHLANNFSHYTIKYGNPSTEHVVPVLKYSELSTFFEQRINMMPQEYGRHFLNILYKQSLAKEDEIKSRFINALTDE